MYFYNTKLLYFSSYIDKSNNGQLFLENTTTQSGYLLIIAIFFVVSLIVVSKLISKKSVFVNRSKYMEVLDRISISGDKQLIIVRVLDEFYVLSLAQNSITLIQKLSSDKIDIQQQDSKNLNIQSFTSFSDFLSSIKNKKNNSD